MTSYFKQFLAVFLLIVLVLSCKKEIPAPLPIPNFYVDNNGCSSDCTVYFYDHSENAVKWKWNFANGSTSSSKTDSTIYTSAGVYEIWLTVWNKDNVADSIRKNITITE